MFYTFSAYISFKVDENGGLEEVHYIIKAQSHEAASKAVHTVLDFNFKELEVKHISIYKQ